MTKRSKSESAALRSMWGKLILSSFEIDNIRDSMRESFSNSIAATTDEEREYWPNDYWGCWLKHDIANAFVANDEVVTNTHLSTLSEVQQEIIARQEWMDAVPLAYFYSSQFQHYLLHALKALMLFQPPLPSQLEANALIDEACLRLSQASGLMRELSRSESIAYGALGAAKSKGDTHKARRLAQQYVENNLLYADGRVKPLKTLTYEVWVLLFNRTKEPGDFPIAGQPDAPTARALRTVSGYISNHYRLLIRRKKSHVARGVASSNQLDT